MLRPTSWIPAAVIHGSSLTNETWSQWYMPAYFLGGWLRKAREEQLAQIFKKQ